MYLAFKLGFEPKIDTKKFKLIYIDLGQENPKNIFGHTWQEKKSHKNEKKMVFDPSKIYLEDVKLIAIENPMKIYGKKMRNNGQIFLLTSKCKNCEMD